MTDQTRGMPPFLFQCLSAQEWAEYVASYDFGPVAPTRLVLHHTYIPNEKQWKGRPTLEGIQRYYAGLGWRSAPHLFVGLDGIWLATPMEDIGIHAGTGNSGRVNGELWYSIGLEMVGYFDRKRPSGPVWELSKAVMGGLSRRLGIPPRKLISFHRDYTNLKSCPGWAVTKPWVFDEVEAWLAAQAENSAAPPAASWMQVIDPCSSDPADNWAAVRQGPGASYPIALGGTAHLYPGTIVEVDQVRPDGWSHLANDLGFVATTLLRPYEVSR
ncbi:MAG TPA: peptidoglycan recognition family protein [Roseiflexaceae bacterium]|nr:peptidoglycan recognition family protein [Roseiflexaceae bacterium]